MKPSDSAYIACVKNVYKKWLNLELYKNPIVPTKFKKIEKLAEIVYSMRPEIGKYCWDKTIFRDEKELDIPEEMIESNVEFHEEIVQKLTYGVDQMFIEEGMESEEVEGNEEVEYFDLVPVPDQVPDLVEVSRFHTPPKKKVQTRISSFFAGKK